VRKETADFVVGYLKPNVCTDTCNIGLIFKTVLYLYELCADSE